MTEQGETLRITAAIEDKLRADLQTVGTTAAKTTSDDRVTETAPTAVDRDLPKKCRSGC